MGLIFESAALCAAIGHSFCGAFSRLTLYHTSASINQGEVDQYVARVREHR